MFFEHSIVGDRHSSSDTPATSARRRARRDRCAQARGCLVAAWAEPFGQMNLTGLPRQARSENCRCLPGWWTLPSEGEHYVLGMRPSGRHEGRLSRSCEGEDRPVWLGYPARRRGPDPPAVVLHGRANHVRRARTGGYRSADEPSLGPAAHRGEAPDARQPAPAWPTAQAHRRTDDPDHPGRRADRAPAYGRRAIRARDRRASGGARGWPRSLAVGARVSRGPGWSAGARDSDASAGYAACHAGGRPSSGASQGRQDAAQPGIG
jgi:hypothetical protein